MTLKDFIVEQIETWPIVEAAMARDRFKERIYNYISQIIQNYVLIRYTQECGTPQQKLCIHHWLNELNAPIKELHRVVLAVSKERAYHSALYDFGIDCPEEIRNECEDKLEKENIELQDVPFEIWNECLKFIQETVPAIICAPKHFSTKTELEYKLKID